MQDSIWETSLGSQNWEHIFISFEVYIWDDLSLRLHRAYTFHFVSPKEPLSPLPEQVT